MRRRPKAGAGGHSHPRVPAPGAHPFADMPFSLVGKKSQKKPSFRRAFPYPDRQLQRLAAELPGELQVVRTADRVVPVEVVVRVVDVAEVDRTTTRMNSSH